LKENEIYKQSVEEKYRTLETKLREMQNIPESTRKTEQTNRNQKKDT